MSFTRKKTIEMDGVSVVIAPLFSKDMDILLEKQLRIFEEAELPIEEKIKKINETWSQLIADGLNNANGIDPDHKFTAENVHQQFDKPFLKRLKDEISEMSGIEVRNQVVGAEGEAKAPSTSPS